MTPPIAPVPPTDQQIPSSTPAPSPTPPTNPQPDGTSNPPVNNAPPAEFFAVLAEKDREIAELRRASSTPTPAPAPNHDDENKLFYENPSAFFSRKIKDAVQQQVAPLNTFVQQQEKENQINTVLTQLGLYPIYAHYIKQPAFVAAVKASLAQVAHVDQNTIVAIANAVIGSVATGQVQGITSHLTTPAPQPVPSNNPPAPVNPPYIPPTPPAMPAHTNQQGEKRQLTEAERRYARASGLTDEQYIAALEGSSRSFVNTPRA